MTFSRPVMFIFVPNITLGKPVLVGLSILYQNQIELDPFILEIASVAYILYKLNFPKFQGIFESVNEEQ